MDKLNLWSKIRSEGMEQLNSKSDFGLFFRILDQKNDQKQSSYDPRDPSKKIRSEILVKFRV